ncbi:alkaline phosphatase family protein [Polycladidibacter hongkongensis]|uniref:alkaline phosphatase family protein n=1 Tax=Polycladidibacter hongkongensis TaxID=1647556 RepID=UPI000835643C|nr:alkaline phosphatase family protein [Pseudovibrio hongkongensis]
MAKTQRKKNVLWIMCDQLRFDYLSCYGHPNLHTPNIDGLAARGVRFNRAYVQSPICGPSRMSFYTGRYVHAHGSTWNGTPLKVGELTLGDHLAEQGLRNVLVGKTHMRADLEGMARLGIDPDSIIGVRVAQCGFEVYERDDGLHPGTGYGKRPAYDKYLEDKGFTAENPWEHWANSGENEKGELLNGWLLRHADKPARVEGEHSETPYMIGRAMDFMRETKEDGWCLHLSLIKPHWPYIVPAPYHDMYSEADVLPVIRSEAERENAHPVYAAFMDERVSRNFSKDGVRERVIPAYMGLIKQIDDQIGVLMQFMADQDLLDNTMIIFCSDHGDYLGDHWLGEKELFHDQSARIPLIVVDPDAAADSQRGTVSDQLVEAIDLAPTILDYMSGTQKQHVLQGRSLLPILREGKQQSWRGYAVSEYDYSHRRVRVQLDQQVDDCRLAMIMDERWKYIHAEGYAPMLYDLHSDPQELHDLGEDPACADVRARLSQALFAWYRQHHTRTTISPDKIIAGAPSELGAGILIGYWDEEEVAHARNVGEWELDPSTALSAKSKEML